MIYHTYISIHAYIYIYSPDNIMNYEKQNKTKSNHLVD